MLTLQPHQVNTLSRHVRDRALARLRRIAETHLAELIAPHPPATRDTLIDAVMRTGADAGCVTEREHTLWLALSLATGRDPRDGPQAAQVRRVLANEAAPMENRLRQLVGGLGEGPAPRVPRPAGAQRAEAAPARSSDFAAAVV